MPSPVTILRADLVDQLHAAAIVDCLDAYARDPMGGAKPLSDEVKANVVAGLQGTPGAMVWLAQDGDAYVGVVVAFACYSTFAAKPRWNVHDVGVKPEARGKGVGRAMLETVLAEAEAEGCVAVSLEVRHDNAPARHLYASLGFGDDFAPMDFWVRRFA
ncbi:MAG: GNAT family N-acetyltransferase [Solirubrobacteraceae bacterium]|nr:GNAT family N-acetyltransferase [Solirubrobacteraceae bacterium]